MFFFMNIWNASQVLNDKVYVEFFMAGDNLPRLYDCYGDNSF